MILGMAVALILGAILGFSLEFLYPPEYSFYITIGLLAALDSVIGAIKADFQCKYDAVIFASGLITNAVLAVILTFAGDKLGVPLYYAAIFVFGGRLFNNLAVIRRILIERYREKKQQNL